MAKRIIKETLQNGDIQYRVEKQNRFTKKWKTDIITIDTIYGCQDCSDAIFSTLEEAKRFCGINPVIKREVVLNI